MLVLSRKPGEKLVFGQGVNQIVVQVVRVNGNRVTLGIDAPREIPVLRGELRPLPPAEPKDAAA